MTFLYSTPQRYVNALKAENVRWPVIRDRDFFPYYEKHTQYWSGFFSSRPGLKKQTKDYSSLFNSQNKLFASKVIDQSVTDDEVSQILGQVSNTEDILSVLMHHDAITGTSVQYVANDYSWGLSTAFHQS
jgi:hypothetical protein